MDGSMPRRSLRLRVALLVSLSLVPVFLLPATARACSCVRADLEDSIREMGVNAFVGAVTRVSDRDGGVIYRFQVDDAVAGNLGSKLVAESTPPDGGGSCGVDLVVGERAAFVLGRHAATWVVSTCGQKDPDDMLQAASFLGFLQSRSAYPWFALFAVVFVIGVIGRESALGAPPWFSLLSVEILGLGVDICEIGRMERALARHPTFRARVFTPEEIAYCDSKARPAESFAGRFAAREAVIKALGGYRGRRWQDISVARHPSGAPSIVIAGNAKARADALGVSRVMITFTHEKTNAVAFAVAVAES